MSRLIVHVGPPKTASTSIQRGLYDNRREFAYRGVYLPMSGRLELEPRSIAHHHLGWELMGSPRFRPDLGGWDALEEELASVDAETVLLSSEILGLGLVAPGVGRELERRLRSLGREVTIVYVVRDQLSQINSYYAQRVKTLERVPDFDVYVRDLVARGEADLNRQTSRWYNSSAFDFVAIPFPSILDSHPLVELLQAARIPVPLAGLRLSRVRSNVTLGPTGVAAFRLLEHYLRGINPEICEDDEPVRRLHRVAAHVALESGWSREPYWGWTPPLATEVADQLAGGNERFARAVWGRGWSMPMPLDRATVVMEDPMSLPESELARLHEFVVGMGKRYARLRWPEVAAQGSQAADPIAHKALA